MKRAAESETQKLNARNAMPFITGLEKMLMETGLQRAREQSLQQRLE
jgi:hypothetical protein